MLDSNGVIRSDRKELSEEKSEFATNRKIDTLDEAMKNADVFVGLVDSQYSYPRNVTFHGQESNCICYGES